MTKFKFSRVQRLLKALNNSGRGNDAVAKAAVIGLLFGMGWVQEASAAGLTPEQLVQKIASKLTGAEQQALVAEIQAVMAAPEVTTATADALAAKLTPLAVDAGLSEAELLKMLKEAGFTDAQLAKFSPELQEEFIQARLNTPDAIKAADAGTTAATSSGEGVLAAAPAIAPLAGIGAVGVAAAAGGGGGAGVVAAGGGGGGALAFAGELINGYIRGATVFQDLNGNGVLDAGEPTTTTDANGAFTFATPLTNTTAPIIAFGGVDISSGQAYTNILKAPVGSAVITPLTTLVQALVDQGLSVSDALSTVGSVLGLPPGVDVLNFDPEQAANEAGGNAIALEAALKIKALGVMVGNLLDVGEGLLGGAGNSSSIAAAIATQLQLAASSNGALDLGNAAALTSILNSAAADLGIDLPLNATAVLTNLAGLNSQIVEVIEGGGTLEDILDAIADIQDDAQNSAPELQITEDQAQAFLAEGMSYPDATDVTLQVEGTTLSNKGLSLAGLQSLGVDTVLAADNGGAPISVALGEGFTFDDVQGNALTDDGGVQFQSAGEVTLGLSASATEFSNTGKLTALAGLGIDGLALVDGGTLGVSVGEALNVQAADLVFADDFTSFEGGAEVTNLTSVVLNVDGTSLSDSPLTLKALTALGIDVLQGIDGQKLTVDVGATSIDEFDGETAPTFADNVIGNVLVDDDFIASFDSNQAASDFFDAIGADVASIKVGSTGDASLSTILDNLENINDGKDSFADLDGEELVEALADAGVEEIVYDTDNPITDVDTSRLEALADAGLLRAETDQTLNELGDLDEAEAASEVNTLGIEGVRMTVNAGIEFTGDDEADAAALDDLLAKFDSDTSGAVDADENLFANNAKITLSVDTSDMSLTGDQLQDLINLGVDSLVNQDGTTVDIIGKTGDQTDIFGNNN